MQSVVLSFMRLARISTSPALIKQDLFKHIIEECLPKFWCILELQKRSYELQTTQTMRKRFFFYYAVIFWAKTLIFFVKKLKAHMFDISKFHQNRSQVIGRYFCGLLWIIRYFNWSALCVAVLILLLSQFKHFNISNYCVSLENWILFSSFSSGSASNICLGARSKNLWPCLLYLNILHQVWLYRVYTCSTVKYMHFYALLWAYIFMDCTLLWTFPFMDMTYFSSLSYTTRRLKCLFCV